ncbi:universal stress protein [Thermopetrobacter sp. TC1]|uniref:universal stress protein n=1 Tax=Thermopetrobacter sp. TC1 TaxID=1495045 RepID=UPI001E3973C9|nr:universal stress protein [Thermopetrobacter sp. TC1]
MTGMTYKNILLPIDLGHASSWKKALPVALDLARLYGAHLNVLTVIPDVGMPVVGSFFPADFEKKAREKAQEALEKWMDENLPEDLDVKADAYVAVGTIYDEIIAVANKLNIDLIVMASHRPKMKDYLLGPNAARVVRHARQDVLVVRS